MKANPTRSQTLITACETADRAMDEAYRTYAKKDFVLAAKACLDAAIIANKEKASDWANKYGKKHADMNKKACGG